MIEILCPVCESVFQKTLKRYNDNIRNNHNNNCRVCSERIREEKKVDNDLGRLINECNRRAMDKKLKIDITKEYLEHLWIKQDGKCAISGLPLEKFLRSIPNTPFTVSVDRIDSSKGYGDGCGKLMYDAWGGKTALRWAESKINAAEREKMTKQHFAIDSERSEEHTSELQSH